VIQRWNDEHVKLARTKDIDNMNCLECKTFLNDAVLSAGFVDLQQVAGVAYCPSCL